MRRLIFIALIGLSVFYAVGVQAGLFDSIINKIMPSKSTGLDNEKVVAGLKEALNISTEKAVDYLSRPDGFLKNQAVKIMIPEKIRGIADTLRRFGMGGVVDSFEESMNHAAEKAVVKAVPIFKQAIKDMSFEDAMRILKGPDTAATEYFKAKTWDRLFETFRPIVSDSMNQVGVTRQYKALTEKAKMVSAFTKTENLDLDRYVTNESLKGLFYMIGEEEKKIRKDPAARVTTLLKEVFGSREK